MPYVPTIRGRRLARELRRLRESLSLRGEDAATRLGWDQAKISRIENAKIRVTVGEVMELCEAYEISGNERAALIQLAREARISGWWETYRSDIMPGFTDYLAFEAEANRYHSYQVQLIPGLLQTEDYARTILQHNPTPRSPEELERILKVRMARQSRLTSIDRSLQVWQIMEEAALRRIVGSPALMHTQLDHLLKAGQLPNVSLQVVPYRAGAHVALDGQFTLLGFDDYPDVLYVEHFGGCQYMEKPEETMRATVAFEHLRATALNVVDSAALIQQVADELPKA
ncbi:helix-turn-helix domain-containing protein [Spirillospora sp. NPDC127200]